MDRQMPTYAVETITPQIAEEYLRHNQRNRKPKKRTIAAYAATMRGGNWLLTGETIQFDWCGTLINGQHRLMAVIEAGIPVQFSVARDCAPDTARVIDNLPPRTATDAALYAGEHGFTNTHAAICRALFMYGRDPRLTNARLTNDQVLRLYNRHREPIDFALSCGPDRWAPAVSMSVIARALIRDVPRDPLQDFAMIVGSNQPTGTRNPSAPLALFKFLAANRLATGGTSMQMLRTKMTETALFHFLSDVSVKLLRAQNQTRWPLADAELHV